VIWLLRRGVGRGSIGLVDDSADILPACAENALVWLIADGRASICHDAIDRRSTHSGQ